MKPRYHHIGLMAVVAALAACSGGGNHHEANSYAVEQGRKAAQRVIDAPVNTMAREKAVLEIRANEEKILQLGDTLGARDYVEAAHAALDSAGIKL